MTLSSLFRGLLWAPLVVLISACASAPDKDGLSGPSIDPPNEDYYGSGHSRTTTNTEEVNVGLGRYKKTF